MSEAIIAKKVAIASEVSERFTAAASVAVADYRGLTVDEVTRLHKQPRGASVEMKVTKNSISSCATKKVGFEGMDEAPTGSTAATFSNENVVVLTRIMDEFTKEAKVLETKGGVIEGKVLSLKKIAALARLSNHEGLLSMLLSVLQVSVRNVAYAVKAVADREDGDAA